MSDIVQIGESSQKDEWLKKQKADFEHALKSLIEGKVYPSDFPGNRIPTRPIRGGTTTRFVPAWWFVKNANALFNRDWDFEVLREYIGTDQVWVLVKVTVHVAALEEEETFPDGRKIVRRKPTKDITKMQYGGADIKRLKTDRSIIDLADDLKSAATDGMKKCLTLFGFAADVYGAREKEEEAAPESAQLDAYYEAADEKGIGRAEAVKFSIKKKGKRPEELVEKEMLDLLGQIRKEETRPEKA